MKKTILVLISIVFGASIIFWYCQICRHSRPHIGDTVIIGTSADYPPMEFKKNDAIIGFDIDVINEACDRAGKKCTITNMPFDLLLPQLQLGSINIIAAGFTKTAEREKKALFTRPYLGRNPLVILSKADQPAITSIDDLREKKVVVNRGYTSDVYISKLPSIFEIRVPTIADAIQELMDGKASYFVTESRTLKPILDKYGQDTFNMYVIEDTDENATLAISKLYPELLDCFDQALKDMQQDGTLDALMEKWHVQ